MLRSQTNTPVGSLKTVSVDVILHIFQYLNVHDLALLSFCGTPLPPLVESSHERNITWKAKYQQYFPREFSIIPEGLLGSQDWPQLFKSTYQREYKFLPPKVKSIFSLMHMIDIEGMKKAGLTFNDLDKPNEATASGKTLLDIAVASGNQKLFDYLFDLYVLQNSINLNNLKEALGRPTFNDALNHAELFKQKKFIERIIDLESGEKKDDACLSLARLAISSSDTDLIKNVLIKVSPTDRFINENNLFLLAIESGSPEIVLLLLKNGANIFFRDSLMRRLEAEKKIGTENSLDLSSLQHENLHAAILEQIKQDDFDIVRKFLSLEGELKGGTLLHAAAYVGCLDVAVDLLDNSSVDINTLDNAGDRKTQIMRYNPRRATKLETLYDLATPLLCAVHRGHYQVVNYLLKLNLNSPRQDQRKLNLGDMKDCLKAAIAQNNPYIFELIVDFIAEYKEFAGFSPAYLENKFYKDLLLPATKNLEIFNIMRKNLPENAFNGLNIYDLIKVSHVDALRYIVEKKLLGVSVLEDRKKILLEVFSSMLPDSYSPEDVKSNRIFVAPIFFDLCKKYEVDLNDLRMKDKFGMDASIFRCAVLYLDWYLARLIKEHGYFLTESDMNFLSKRDPKEQSSDFFAIVGGPPTAALIDNKAQIKTEQQYLNILNAASTDEHCISILTKMRDENVIFKDENMINFILTTAIPRGYKQATAFILNRVKFINESTSDNLLSQAPKCTLDMAILIYVRVLSALRETYHGRDGYGYASFGGLLAGKFGRASTPIEKQKAIDCLIKFLKGEGSIVDLQEHSSALSNGRLKVLYNQMSWVVNKITEEQSMHASSSYSTNRDKR